MKKVLSLMLSVIMLTFMLSTIVANALSPIEVYVVDVYDYSFGLEDKVVIEAKIDSPSHNGTTKIMVGDEELYYSTERGVYVGIVDATDVYETVLYNTSILNEEPTIFSYGKEPTTHTILSSTLLKLKLYLEALMEFENIKLIASDVNADGRVNNADLLQLKLYMESGREFTILSK